MILKDLEREYLGRPTRRGPVGNVVDIAEWLEVRPSDTDAGSPRYDQELYWQRFSRQKLRRSRVDEPGRPPDADLAALFRRLADEWRRETMSSSSMTDIVLHPAYQRIIGLGDQVVPLIFEELQREPYHWFWALSAITGDDPGAEETTLDGATARWLDWARRRGLVEESRIA